MIQIIAGKKGSGKTKRLIDMTNAFGKDSAKDTVFLDDDDRYMLDIARKVRFVNVSEYGVEDAKMFLAFVSGMLSQNYDIGTIFIDAFIKLAKVDMNEAAWLFEAMEKLSAKHDVNFVCSVSEDPANLPEFVAKYII